MLWWRVVQKPMETSGFGRQDSSGPHTLGLMLASTTQLLATRSHLPAATVPAAHMPAPAAAMLADLTAASAVAEWAPAAGGGDDVSGDAGAELEMTPPPRTPAGQPQVHDWLCLCTFLFNVPYHVLQWSPADF